MAPIGRSGRRGARPEWPRGDAESRMAVAGMRVDRLDARFHHSPTRCRGSFDRGRSNAPDQTPESLPR